MSSIAELAQSVAATVAATKDDERSRVGMDQAPRQIGGVLTGDLSAGGNREARAVGRTRTDTSQELGVHHDLANVSSGVRDPSATLVRYELLGTYGTCKSPTGVCRAGVQCGSQVAEPGGEVERRLVAQLLTSPGQVERLLPRERVRPALGYQPCDEARVD